LPRRGRDRSRSLGLLFRRAHVLRALLDVADAGEVFVELPLSVELTRRLSEATCSITRSSTLRLRWLPRFSNRLSNASDG
jgi:hypothetical protein